MSIDIPFLSLGLVKLRDQLCEYRARTRARTQRVRRRTLSAVALSVARGLDVDY